MLKEGTRNPRVSLLGQGQFGKVYRVDGPISMTIEQQKYSFHKGASKASSGVVPRSITYGAVAVKILKKPTGPGSNSSDGDDGGVGRITGDQAPLNRLAARHCRFQ